MSSHLPPSAPAHRRRGVPSWVRIAGDIVVGVLLWLVGVCASMVALTALPWAFTGGVVNAVGVLVVLGLLPVWGTVFVRKRWPWVPFITGAVMAVGWGDCLLMLIGLFQLVIRAPRRQALGASVIGSAVVIGSVVRMCLQPSATNPFSLLFVSASGQPAATGLPLPPPPPSLTGALIGVTIAAGVIALGVSLGAGHLLRRTRRMRAVEALASHESQRNEVLSAELARQSERELLARELHDTLSHRLSIISLHSGALEVGSAGDPEVASTASALRQEVQASLEDLRHLVGGVRSGSFTQTSGEARPPAPVTASMRSIPQLIASVQATGASIRPTIIIGDVDRAPALLDRAVYRIVQESLTNALKHAPGAPVDLSVSAAAADGVLIRVSNPVGAADAASDGLAASGSRAGLDGIRERVAVLGGTVDIGVHSGEFIVAVAIPSFLPSS